MPGIYGVLGGTDAASLIQQEEDGTTWRAVARGKMAELREIADRLNMGAPAFLSGIRIPDDAPTHAGLDLPAVPDFNPDMLERNRAAVERELSALPIDWNTRYGAINRSTLQELHPDALAELSARLWSNGDGTYRDGETGRRYTKYAADYLTQKQWR